MSLAVLHNILHNILRSLLGKLLGKLLGGLLGGLLIVLCFMRFASATAAFLPAADLKANLLTVASLTKAGEPIKAGLVWRVYIAVLPKKPMAEKAQGGQTSPVSPSGQGGQKSAVAAVDAPDMKQLKQVQMSRNAQGQFTLPQGEYYVQANFGRITAMDKVKVEKNAIAKLVLNLDAGAVQLNAEATGGQIAKDKLHFAIYANDAEGDDGALILPNISPDMPVRLKAGRYHVVSYYGKVNATERANINIVAGKLSRISFQQKAARITLRLMHEPNGDALANTKWSIADASGDVVYEAADAYLSVVLAAGHYVAIAQNNGIFQKDFVVESGKDTNVDVLTVAKPQKTQDANQDKADNWATD